jgi:hypothetical protein
MLPGGQSMLITICPLDARANDDYWLGVVRPGSMQPPKRLTKGSFARYLPSTGHVVFLRQSSLYAGRFDLARLEFVSEPVPVLAIDSFFPVCANANLAISARGDLVYVPTVYPTRSVRWLDVDRARS